MHGAPEIHVQIDAPNLTTRIMCPQPNRRSCELNFEIGDGIIVGTDTQVWFQFSDMDVSDHDDAGSVGVTLDMLTDGRGPDAMPPDGLERHLTTSSGVRFTLRVREE